MKIDKVTIRNVVGRAFIRVMKNHNNYHLFIERFNKLKYGDMSQHIGMFTNLDSLMAEIDKLSNETRMPKSDTYIPRKNIYDSVTFMINHLIHFFLEGNVNSHHLCMYGQEVFDLSCYTLLGDVFISDMNEFNKTHGNQNKEIEAMIQNNVF